MAVIISDTIVIKLSKLARGNAKSHELVSSDFINSLEAVVSEMLDDPTMIVEVLTKDESADD